MPIQSQLVRAGEVRPVSGSVQAVPGEGTSDGSAAMESLNPVLCSNPEATQWQRILILIKRAVVEILLQRHCLRPRQLHQVTDHRARLRTMMLLHVDTLRRLYGAILGDSRDHPTVTVIGCN